MKRILSTILCLALVMTTLTEKSFAFNYIPTNTDDPSCIDVRKLETGSPYISYKGAKEVCGCKTCDALILPYTYLDNYLESALNSIHNDSSNISNYLDSAKLLGTYGTNIIKYVEVPVATLNGLLSKLGLANLSVGATVVVIVTGITGGSLIATKYVKYSKAFETNLNIENSLSELRQLSSCLDKQLWKNNNFILIVRNNVKKHHQSLVSFRKKAGLQYEDNKYNEEYFNKSNDILKLIILSTDPSTKEQFQDLIKKLSLNKDVDQRLMSIQSAKEKYEFVMSNKSDEILNDLLTGITGIVAIGSSVNSTVNASKVAAVKEKEKLEKTQNNTKEAGTQTQNDQAIQTETKGTQANTNANASTNENKLTDKMEKAIKDKAEELVNKATAEKAVQANNVKIEKPAVNAAAKGTASQKAEFTNTAKNNTPKPNENKSLSIFKNPFNSDKENASKFEASINVNTSKQIDDRRINIKAKPGANITFNQFIYNQTETIHNPEAATAT